MIKHLSIILIVLVAFGCEQKLKEDDFIGIWEGDVWAERVPGIHFDETKEKHELIFYPNDSFKLTVFHTEWKCRLGEINPQYGT